MKGNIEIWIDIAGFEGKYQVSNLGNVKSVAKQISCHQTYLRSQREIILRPSKKKNGYLAVSLSFDSKRTYISVHRLVALNFIPNPDKKEVVNHLDGDKHNNRVDNLEWNTQSQNVKHCFKSIGRSKPSGMKDIKGGINPLSRKVMQCDLAGNEVRIWNCMNDAKRDGFSIGNIYSCCQGKRKSHKGFKWTYFDLLKEDVA